MSPNNPELLDLTALAEYIGVSKKSLYNSLGKTINPPRFKVGREYRFLKTSIDAWLAGLEGNAAHNREQAGA